MAVVVTGIESVFTPTIRLELRSAVAREAGVEVSAVRLDVAAVARLRELRRELQGSSVTLTFTIITSAAAAAATVNALSSRLANPTVASAFLTTPSYTASVTSIASLPVATYALEAQVVSSNTGSSNTGLIIGVAVGGTIAALFVVTALFMCLRRTNRKSEKEEEEEEEEKFGASGKEEVEEETKVVEPREHDRIERKSTQAWAADLLAAVQSEAEKEEEVEKQEVEPPAAAATTSTTMQDRKSTFGRLTSFGRSTKLDDDKLPGRSKSEHPSGAVPGIHAHVGGSQHPPAAARASTLSGLIMKQYLRRHSTETIPDATRLPSPLKSASVSGVAPTLADTVRTAAARIRSGRLNLPPSPPPPSAAASTTTASWHNVHTAEDLQHSAGRHVV
jgi:large-conductance mechanosensitive channel